MLLTKNCLTFFISFTFDLPKNDFDFADSFHSEKKKKKNLKIGSALYSTKMHGTFVAAGFSS
jgi:hypothetical protein